MFFVYLHKKGDTGEPFYVGKGTGKRIYFHSGRNQWWHNIVAKHGIAYEFLGYFELEVDAFAYEKDRIAFYRSEGYTLCNLTDGGEGASGRVLSEESRAKMIASAKAKPAQSQEARTKRSQSMSGRVRSPEHCAALSEVQKGKPHSSEHTAKVALARLGMKLSDETKARMSASSKTRPPISEETRQRLRDVAVLREQAKKQAQALLTLL
jgi:hypothetical protein